MIPLVGTRAPLHFAVQLATSHAAEDRDAIARRLQRTFNGGSRRSRSRSIVVKAIVAPTGIPTRASRPRCEASGQTPPHHGSVWIPFFEGLRHAQGTLWGQAKLELLFSRSRGTLVGHG
jgi:hypothetical protein